MTEQHLITEQEYKNAVKAEGRIEILLELIDNYYQEEISTFEQLSSDSNDSIAVFVGGGSCSGKSTIRRDLIESFDNALIVVDSDHLKEIIPEYNELFLSYGFKTASIVHNESSHMAKLLTDKIIKECNNFLYDGTLKNTEKYEILFSLLRKHHYKISLHIVDCDIELAIRRNKARALKESRVVPDKIIRESHQKIANSFLVLKNLVDEWVLYNTNGEAPIIIAASGTKIKEESLYQAFLAKGKNVEE
ncbi:zeta toxin family protein [Avibacterium sp. 21-599]|uniref:zeta toxin family protein n=1 Tax=Avibacterium sp. 21-599 TaxID=2911528 RepID=UPI002247F95D|nr:zeta toxin family protein [Avibacterium sp. 21-599]MCW9718872.1 zeta toxin family protein [Avibacterium sp. 21-599]